jgi:hypothetical protein
MKISSFKCVSFIRLSIYGKVLGKLAVQAEGAKNPLLLQVAYCLEPLIASDSANLVEMPIA